MQLTGSSNNHELGVWCDALIVAYCVWERDRVGIEGPRTLVVLTRALEFWASGLDSRNCGLGHYVLASIPILFFF